MTPLVVAAIVLGVLLMDCLIVRTLVRAGWDSLADSFPAAPIAPDAVRRHFQSFGFNMVNLGLCVHVAADESHLHLLPAAFPRWCGCAPMSIPWDAITIRSRGRRVHKASVGSVTVKGPAWCLNLADPPAASPGSPSRDPS
ncbi:MAG: hypothetical protein ACKVU4_00770 [Phycisphaerales bacterium]